MSAPTLSPAIRPPREAKPQIRSLRELARLAAPHADGTRAVSRIGCVVAAGEAEARVAGLSAYAAPGMSVRLGDGFATVSRVDRAACVLTLDRPGARPDDTAELLPPPPHIDGSWLGRTVDALGRPLGEGIGVADASVHDPLPLDTGRPVVTGVGAIDALAPVMPGERWVVRGAAGSGRTTLLRMIADCGAWDAVVLCAVTPRLRERAGWLTATPNRLTILPSWGAGPAEVDAALALAGAAARDLARTHPRTVLLIDGAARTPPLDSVTTFYTGGGDDAAPCDGAIVLDTALAARGVHPAVDIAATLAATPPPPGDQGTHAALRALAARGGATLDEVRAALAQSPGGQDAGGADDSPDPGAIVTRAALADLVRSAGPPTGAPEGSPAGYGP